LPQLVKLHKCTRSMWSSSRRGCPTSTMFGWRSATGRGSSLLVRTAITASGEGEGQEEGDPRGANAGSTCTLRAEVESGGYKGAPSRTRVHRRCRRPTSTRASSRHGSPPPRSATPRPVFRGRRLLADHDHPTSLPKGICNGADVRPFASAWIKNALQRLDAKRPQRPS
jgi:hypothetical protein